MTSQMSKARSFAIILLTAKQPAAVVTATILAVLASPVMPVVAAGPHAMALTEGGWPKDFKLKVTSQKLD